MTNKDVDQATCPTCLNHIKMLEWLTDIMMVTVMTPTLKANRRLWIALCDTNAFNNVSNLPSPTLFLLLVTTLTICHSCLATEEAFLAKERDGKGDSVAIAGFLFVKVFDVAQTLSREEAVKRREFISACHIFTPSLNCTLRIKESFSHTIDNCHYYRNTYRKL